MAKGLQNHYLLNQGYLKDPYKEPCSLQSLQNDLPIRLDHCYVIDLSANDASHHSNRKINC